MKTAQQDTGGHARTAPISSVPKGGSSYFRGVPLWSLYCVELAGEKYAQAFELECAPLLTRGTSGVEPYRPRSVREKG